MSEDGLLPMTDEHHLASLGFSSPALMVQKMTDSAQSALEVMSSVAGPMSPSQQEARLESPAANSWIQDDAAVNWDDESDSMDDSRSKRVKFSD